MKIFAIHSRILIYLMKMILSLLQENGGAYSMMKIMMMYLKKTL